MRKGEVNSFVDTGSAPLLAIDLVTVHITVLIGHVCCQRHLAGQSCSVEAL